MRDPYLTINDLIDKYLTGNTEGRSGPKGEGNLKIVDNKLIHYNTTLLERVNGTYILNYTRYSKTTGVLQNRLKNQLVERGLSFTTLTRVPKDYMGNLSEIAAGKEQA